MRCLLYAPPGSQLSEPLLDLINGGVGRGGARRDAHGLRSFKPFLAQIVRRLHMMHAVRNNGRRS